MFVVEVYLHFVAKMRLFCVWTMEAVW